MKFKLFQLMLLLLFTQWAFAGGSEVPWPDSIQREVFVNDMQGTWVSKNLNSPQRAFEIKVQEANFNESCPYVVTVSELSPYTGEVQAKDMDVICSSFMRKMIFMLADDFGQARYQIEIVGIWKDEEDKHLGKQFLGITVYNYGEIAEKVYQDTFYKLSR